ncbi:MAG: PAS domain-containing protein, partial [Acidimicrobiales bacterium]
MFQALSLHSACALLLFERSGAARFANPAAARLAGRGEGELLGEGWRRCVPALERPRLTAAIARAAAGAGEVAVEHHLAAAVGCR